MNMIFPFMFRIVRLNRVVCDVEVIFEASDLVAASCSHDSFVFLEMCLVFLPAICTNECVAQGRHTSK